MHHDIYFFCFLTCPALQVNSERLALERREIERLAEEIRETRRMTAELREAQRVDAERWQTQRVEAERRGIERSRLEREEALLKDNEREEALFLKFEREERAQQEGYLPDHPSLIKELQQQSSLQQQSNTVKRGSVALVYTAFVVTSTIAAAFFRGPG